MKKKDLHPHHIVERRNGGKGIWENFDSNDYNKDLFYVGDYTDYDIMRVYGFDYCVWEREDTSEVELSEDILSLACEIKDYLKSKHTPGTKFIISDSRIELNVQDIKR